MKKVLVITYYWPPAGGPGVQRVLNIVENLPEFGWEPIVLTVENPSAPAFDKSLVSRIPEECKVYRTRTNEPFAAYKKLTGKKTEDALPKNIPIDKKISLSECLSRWVRANFFIPDARKGWKRFMIKKGLSIIEEEKPDIIFSTSPPHSLQLGAKQLAKKTGIPWVADFRDPWTEAYWETQMPKSSRSKKKNLKYEEDILSAVNKVTTVGKGIQALIQKKTLSPVEVIYNGYREINNEYVPSPYFEILHLGNLGAMQSCKELLEAVSCLEEEKKRKLRLVFIGTIANEYKVLIEKKKDINTEYIDFLPYDKMITRASSASMLFLPRLNSSYSKSLISAKLFDYLALRRPVLAIADRGSDIENILRHTKSGRSFLSNEIKEISTYISNTMDITETQKVIPLKNNELKQYSSHENVYTLVKIFNDLIV